MTLDLDAGDHRRLGDRLEAWSCFTHADWAIVVRLTPAATFDRRAAYFSHARAFPAALAAGALDPGALLGRSEAFDPPWHEGRRAGGTAPPMPEMVRPEQVAAEPETAAALVAHLLQALLDERPLVMAVPVDDLVAGAPLHALVSFARAALPSRLKRSCRIRVYARSPELFLGRLESQLLVVPEAIASDALAVCRDAVLLDRRAHRHAGRAPDPAVEAWAQKVVLWACERPRALLEFAARYGDRVWDGSGGPPEEREVVAVPVAYRLSEELSDRGDPSRNLLGQLRNAAAKMGPGTIPWRRLLGPEEWDRLPRREALELVLAAPEGLPEGVRELQDAATEAARELGWSGAELLAGGWAPADGGGLRRLVDLSARAPGLVPVESLERRLLEEPLRRLMELGLLTKLLERDDGLEILARRSGETAEVPELLADETTRDLVLEATLAHRLDPEILGGMVQSAAAGGLGGGWLGEWLGSLDTERLLGLASTVAPGGDLLEGAVARALAGRMQLEPAATSALLIRRGAWSWWRRLAPAQGLEARAWALSWLTSTVWDGPPRVDPRLGDWELVMADLGDRLESRELMALLGNGRRSWPWIPLFADRQVEDLAQRMPDLGTLAVLVDRCPGEGLFPRREMEERMFAAFVLERPTLQSLGSTVLRWLDESTGPASLPPLRATACQLLYREAGPRRARLVENLAAWIGSRGFSEEFDEDLFRFLDTIDLRRSSCPSPRERAGARELAASGHRGTARLLDPELDAHLEESDGARKLLDALATDRLEVPFFQEMHRGLASCPRCIGGGAARHPIRELARGVSEGTGPGAPPGDEIWGRFVALLGRFPRFFDEANRDGDEPLPAFELAAVLFEDLSAGALAVRLAFAAPLEAVESDAWWRALLRGIDGCRRRGGRRSALDRPDVARALLARMRPDLPEEGRVPLGRALWLELDDTTESGALGALPQDQSGGGS
jgi:hypothetical protein